MVQSVNTFWMRRSDRTWGFLWTCWNPLSRICKWSALHSSVEVHSTCVSFTHWWLSAAAGFQSVIHHNTFTPLLTWQHQLNRFYQTPGSAPLSCPGLFKFYSFFTISFMSAQGCARLFWTHATFPGLEEAEHQQEKAGGWNSRGMLHNPVVCLFNNSQTIVPKRKRCLTWFKDWPCVSIWTGNQRITNTLRDDQHWCQNGDNSPV